MNCYIINNYSAIKSGNYSNVLAKYHANFFILVNIHHFLVVLLAYFIFQNCFSVFRNNIPTCINLYLSSFC